MNNSLVKTLVTVFILSVIAVGVTGLSRDGEDNQLKKRPNVLLILADDLGYTDLGTFGSEIETPHLDKLAAGGLILTRHYSAAVCAPTRAELLSGVDHHLAGLGMMGVDVDGLPGYSARLNDNVTTIATRLRSRGYNTYMTGKWHLGDKPGTRPASRGFDQSFIMTDGGTSHFSDGLKGLVGKRIAYFDNDAAVEKLPDDFYSTDYYTARMIEYIDSNKGDGKPFFAYLAYTAPHWPLHAPAEEIARYKGKYDKGYEVLREQRLRAWKASGLATEKAELANLPPEYIPWDELDKQEQARQARIMETYAAMITRMDRGIGEVVEYLKNSDELENTLIIFLSDNGADRSTDVPGLAYLSENADNSLDNIGKIGSYTFAGPGWAMASGAPLWNSKSYAGDGGIRVPAFVYGPELGVPRSEVSDALVMTPDWAPTLLDWLDIKIDDSEAGGFAMTGESFKALLQTENSASVRDKDHWVGREHGGSAAIIKGDWKLLWESPTRLYLGRRSSDSEPVNPYGQTVSRNRYEYGLPVGAPMGDGGPWKLINIKNDPAERHDVSAQHPEKLKEMLSHWNEYVSDNQVIVKTGRVFNPVSNDGKNELATQSTQKGLE